MPPLSLFNRTCLALAIGPCLSLPTQAADILVTSLQDTANARDELCTLREAIISANTDDNSAERQCVQGSGADRIYIELPGNITLSSSLPTINTDISIIGRGAAVSTIDGNEQFLVLNIDGTGIPTPSVSINRLTITGGQNNRGGGIYAANCDLQIDNSVLSGNEGGRGGAAYIFFSQVSVNNTTITDNSATSIGGGGVFAYGNGSTLSLSNSTMSENKANTNGGGLFSFYATVKLENSSITGNTSGIEDGMFRDGGGINIFDGTLTIENSIISNNSSYGNGGGISIERSSTAAITNTAIIDNSGGSVGGGVSVRESSLSISNSTISGSLDGGAIDAEYSSSVALNNSTISNNFGRPAIGSRSSEFNIEFSTITGNSSPVAGGAITASSNGSLRIGNSIVTGNFSSYAGVEIYDYSSALTSLGNNLFGDASKSSSQFFRNVIVDSADLIATSDEGNIGLASILDSLLSDNGCVSPVGLLADDGCVLTHKLSPNSPATNAAKANSCPDVDQRGQKRQQGDAFFVVTKASNGKVIAFDLGEDNCDIGAVESTQSQL